MLRRHRLRRLWRQTQIAGTVHIHQARRLLRYCLCRQRRRVRAFVTSGLGPSIRSCKQGHLARRTFNTLLLKRTELLLALSRVTLPHFGFLLLLLKLEFFEQTKFLHLFVFFFVRVRSGV